MTDPGFSVFRHLFSDISNFTLFLEWDDVHQVSFHLLVGYRYTIVFSDKCAYKLIVNSYLLYCFTVCALFFRHLDHIDEAVQEFRR